MPLDESFAPEPDYSPPAVAEPAPAAEPVAEPTPAQPEPTPAAPAAETPTAAQTEAPATPAEAAPAFDEKQYLKDLLGDDAPETAAEARARIAADRARQVTPEIEARLAITNDPAKLAEYAELHRKDYDKMPVVEAMREKFALENPGASQQFLDRNFPKELEKWGERFPTLYAALQDPDSVDPSDPVLLAEKEDADYLSATTREALKKNQTEKTQQFLAALPAANQPQLSDAQKADAAALPAWLDEAFTDGGVLPVALPDGTKLNLPIEKAADLKAAFFKAGELLDAHLYNKDGILNRENQAVVAEMARLGPVAFVQAIAKHARLAQPEPAPAIPVADLTNASAARPAQPAAPPTTARPGPAKSDTDWHRFNI